MMKIFSILFLIPVLSFGQLSPEIDKLTKELSKSERVESSFIGYGEGESKVYKLFTEINKKASDKEVEYIALNGNAVSKAYGAKIAFRRKLKVMERMLTSYLKNNEKIITMQGCMASHSYLADELYQHIFWEKKNIKEKAFKRQYKDSIQSLKNPEEGLLDFVNMLDTEESKWTEKEIDSLLIQFDQLILNDPATSQSLVEFIAESYYYKEIKHPEYYNKLAYFEKKYHSEMIRQYLEFCSN